MRKIQKIRIAVSALGVYILSLTSAAVFAGGSSSLQAQSAEELARYIAAGGVGVSC